MTRIHPTGGTRVTSGFRTKSRPKHDGTDYRTRTNSHPSGIGLPIVTPIAGVVSVGTNSTAGRWVQVKGDDGTIVGFSHLSKQLVKNGARVQAGNSIGESGETGNAKGAHLHFYVLVGGDFVNPVEWLKGGGSSKPKPSTSSGSSKVKLPLKLSTWDHPLVGEVQRVLNAWYPHKRPLLKVDNDLGPKTSGRIRYAESRMGLPRTGTITAALLDRLNIKH